MGQVLGRASPEIVTTESGIQIDSRDMAPTSIPTASTKVILRTF